MPELRNAGAVLLRGATGACAAALIAGIDVLANIATSRTFFDTGLWLLAMAVSLFPGAALAAAFMRLVLKHMPVSPTVSLCAALPVAAAASIPLRVWWLSALIPSVNWWRGAWLPATAALIAAVLEIYAHQRRSART